MAVSMETAALYLEWAYIGVNQTVPRNAGPDCAAYMQGPWRRLETVLVLLGSCLLCHWSYHRLRLPPGDYYAQLVAATSKSSGPPPRQQREQNGCDFTGQYSSQRAGLLAAMCIIWGMEIGYKLSTKTVIYLLMPCHVTTALQIFLLAADPHQPLITALFRFHLNLLNGPLLAFLFPETDTRLLPLENTIYWLQHGMMFIVPYYLLRTGGAYIAEDTGDWSWSVFSYTVNLIYHFAFLQTIAIPTQVNLNHMLCPALVDPFEGQLYRLCAVIHQAILCPILSKLFVWIATSTTGPTTTPQQWSGVNNGHNYHHHQHNKH